MHFKLREEGVEIRCGGLQLGRLATSGIGFAATQVFRRDRGGIEQPRLVDPTAKSSRVASQADHLHLRQLTEDKFAFRGVVVAEQQARDIDVEFAGDLTKHCRLVVPTADESTQVSKLQRHAGMPIEDLAGDRRLVFARHCQKDRKRVEQVKSGSVRVDHGGRGRIKIKQKVKKEQSTKNKQGHIR